MKPEKELALRIKKVREYRNYTQTYMALQLGISQNTYSKIESGITSLKTSRLNKIAEVLKIPIDYIINTQSPLFDIDRKHENANDVGSQVEKLMQILQEEVANLRQQNLILVEVLGRKIKTQKK